jgi:pimeloyl-ACP methyl ester carboxylesterase
MSPEIANRFQALIPDAQLTFLARCGHTPMLERPVAFTEAVADWLEATRERRMRVLPQLDGVH